MVAIETSGGLVHLNPEDGGVVIYMFVPPFTSNDITVDANETLHIYQSTKQFQITGSGFQDNTKASSCCRSVASSRDANAAFRARKRGSVTLILVYSPECRLDT